MDLLANEKRFSYVEYESDSETSPTVNPDIVIYHIWQAHFAQEFGYPLNNEDNSIEDNQPYSKNFKSSQLPDVEFDLFIGVTQDRKFNMYLMKTPCDPANATLNIKADGLHLKKEVINNWGNNRVVINDILCEADHKEYEDFFVAFEITWHGFIKKPAPSPSINIYRHLNNLFTTSDLTDFIIAVDGEEIPTHKVILASQSPVFLAMFKSNMTESVDNRLDIKHIKVEIMKKVIEFLYTGKIDSQLDVNALLSILSVSNEYQIIDLKNLCAHTLGRKITLNDAIIIFEGANLYDVPKLFEKAMRFMVNNKSAIVQRDDFKDLYRRKSEMLLDFILRACSI